MPAEKYGPTVIPMGHQKSPSHVSNLKSHILLLVTLCLCANNENEKRESTKSCEAELYKFLNLTVSLSNYVI